MKDVEKIRDGLYVKKSFDGYRVVYPVKNDDGTWNIKNLLTSGSYWNLVKLLIVLFIIFFMCWSYIRDVRVCRELTERIAENPYEFCFNLTSGQGMPEETWNLTIPESIIIRGGEDDKS